MLGSWVVVWGETVLVEDLVVGGTVVGWFLAVLDDEDYCSPVYWVVCVGHLGSLWWAV